MNSTSGEQTPDQTKTDPAAIASTKSCAERWIIRIMALVVAILVCVALAQSMGHDVFRTIVHLPAFRHRPDIPATTSQTNPFAHLTNDDDSHHAPRRLASDSQVVVPRRKKPTTAESEPTEEIAIPVSVEVPLETRAEAPVIGAEISATPAAAVQPEDLTSTLLEAAAQLVSQSWQEFDYPVAWSVSGTSRARMIYTSHRNRLLKGTSHPHPSALSLDQFRKDYAEAKAQFADDPRLDYAFGLVLWKHQQFTEANELFQTSGRLEGIPFLPAALAVAWGRFSIHEDRRGLDQLAYIVRRLGAMTGEYPTVRQKEQAAVSIGRALGYLSGPGRTEDLAEAVDLTTRNILDRLPDGLKSAVETGRQQSSSRQSELMQLASISGDVLSNDCQKQQQQLHSQVDTLRREMADARNMVTRNHTSYVDGLKQIIKELVDVQGKKEKLTPTLEKMRDSIFQLSTPQGRLDVKQFAGHPALVSTGVPGQFTLVQQPFQVTTLMPETASERATRISQLSKARDDLKKIENDLAKLRNEQRDLVDRRHETDAKHKLEKDDARKVRVSRLNEQRELEQRLQVLDKALRRTMTLRDSMDSVAAYVPWNSEVEGEALWQALTSKASRPPDSDR